MDQTTDPPTLEDRIHALAQQLQDMILEYTLTASSAVVTVDRDYKPPPQLSISRATREKFAQAYYSNTKFLAADAYRGGLGNINEVWLFSLPRNYRSAISHLRINLEHISILKAQQSATIEFAERFYRRMPVHRSCLRCNVILKDVAGKRETHWVDLAGAWRLEDKGWDTTPLQ